MEVSMNDLIFEFFMELYEKDGDLFRDILGALKEGEIIPTLNFMCIEDYHSIPTLCSRFSLAFADANVAAFKDPLIMKFPLAGVEVRSVTDESVRGLPDYNGIYMVIWFIDKETLLNPGFCSSHPMISREGVKRWNLIIEDHTFDLERIRDRLPGFSIFKPDVDFIDRFNDRQVEQRNKYKRVKKDAHDKGFFKKEIKVTHRNLDLEDRGDL
jgi:hypothetical protein